MISINECLIFVRLIFWYYFQHFNWLYQIIGEFKLSSIFISMCFRCFRCFLKLLLRCHSTIYTNKISRAKLNLNPFIVAVDLRFLLLLFLPSSFLHDYCIYFIYYLLCIIILFFFSLCVSGVSFSLFMT